MHPSPFDVARAYVRESAHFAYTTRQNEVLDIQCKEGDLNNVLTNVDLANSARAKTMFQPFTDLGEILIDEENLPPLTPQQVFASGKPLWVIDPIDGTRPFSKGESSWGVMLARVENGTVVYANIDMPALGCKLELNTREGSATVGESRNLLTSTLPSGHGATVHVSNRARSVLELASSHGFENAYAPSAAEMTFSLATGQCALVALPSKAGFWDIAPLMLLAHLNGYVAVFENAPYTPLTLGPDMFLPNWQLKDHIIVTSPETLNTLYPVAAPKARAR